MRIQVLYCNTPMGTLSDEQGSIFFEFAQSFLDAGYNLSPYHLDPAPGLHAHNNLDFLGLHGIFYDSLPDKFGQSVMIEKYGRELSTLEKLCMIADRSLGALSYQPDLDSEPPQSDFIDLLEAVKFSKSLLKEESCEELTKEFVASAISAGGAMPKVLANLSSDKKTIYRNGYLPQESFTYLIKLDVGISLLKSQMTRLEYIYNRMANDSGINVVEPFLIESRGEDRDLFHLALPRFDRINGEKIHIHSYAGIRHLDFRDPTNTYDLFFRTLRGLSKNQNQINQAFKRMIFNYLSINQDDHAKNHAFQLDRHGEWSLTPAYDMTFMLNPKINGSFMSIDGM